MITVWNWIAYILLLIIGAAAAYMLSKGSLKQDIDRENKWAEYENRTRKDKR